MEPGSASSGSEPRAQSSRHSCGSTQGSVWSVLYVFPFMVSTEAGPASTSEGGGWADNDTFPLQSPRDRSPALTGLLPPFQ